MIDEKKLLEDLCEMGKKMQQHLYTAERNPNEAMLEFTLRNQLAMLYRVIEKVKEQPKLVSDRKDKVNGMEKLMIEDGYFEGSYMPKALCSIGRDGKVDDCDTCSDHCMTKDGACTDCAINECFKRLAEYEETGLTPQQMVEIDRLYQEKCEEVARFETLEAFTYYGKQVYVKKED